MGERRLVKVIEHTICPHCSGKISIGMSSVTPSVDWTLRTDVIDGTKKKVRDEVQKMTFVSPDRKTAFLSWLADDSLAFGPEEAEKVLAQARAEAEKK